MKLNKVLKTVILVALLNCSTFCMAQKQDLNRLITAIGESVSAYITNLFVNQFITELFRNILCHRAAILRLKNDIYASWTFNVCLLMNIKQVGKPIDSCCHNFFRIQAHIYCDLEFVFLNLYNWKLHCFFHLVKSSSSQRLNSQNTKRGTAMPTSQFDGPEKTLEYRYGTAVPRL